MAALSRFTLGLLRCLVSLRSAFVWILLTLLLAGAASYIHGSRYAVVAHSPFQSVGTQPPAPERIEAAAPIASASPISAGTPASASQAVRAVHQAGPFVDPESVETDCCERRHAPRGEPAPLRTGVVDPPSLFHRQPGDAVLTSLLPPEPDPSVLTVIQLSISRT